MAILVYLKATLTQIIDFKDNNKKKWQVTLPYLLASSFWFRVRSCALQGRIGSGWLSGRGGQAPSARNSDLCYCKHSSWVRRSQRERREVQDDGSGLHSGLDDPQWSAGLSILTDPLVLKANLQSHSHLKNGLFYDLTFSLDWGR